MTRTNDRPVYRYAQTRRLFDPASIAIVGVSTNPDAFGARMLANAQGYTGRIHLVNPKYTEIGGRPCHPSLEAIGEVPDCVFVAVPREAVRPVVEECVRLGVGGVVIFASGFGESTDPVHRQLQRELVALTAPTPTRLLGPNCVGIMNGVSGLLATFAAIEPRMYIAGTRSIGLISQSGALGIGLAQAVERGVSFSHMLTLGNACDVDVADEIAFLAEDPSCDVIACLFEGTNAPRRLIEAGAIAHRAGKVVVVFKIATGGSGAQAAISHTGSVAGSAAGYEALFERAGFIAVDELESLLETAAFFAKAPRATASGVAVLTPSGGAGIMAADQAELHGVDLPQPGPALKALLDQHIPEFGAARNPCDLTAQLMNNPKSFPACAEAFLQQPDIAAVLTPRLLARAPSAQRAVELGEQARRHGKIACVYSLSGWLEGPGTALMESSPDVAVFRSDRRCFATLAAWMRWSQRQGPDAGKEESRLLQLDAAAHAVVARELDTAGAERMLSEGASKRLLEACGVPMVGNVLVQDAEAAVAAAERVGYPVVLKVETPDLPHKSDAGVLRLDLKDAAAVRGAHAAIMANALKATTAERINGVLVQPMIPAGLELMIGAKVDPLFGPMVVVGLGGVLVELLHDAVAALAPVDRSQARAMLGRLKGARLLQGFRGSAPIDQDAVAEAISRVSILIDEARDRIAEIDVNPIICSADRTVAVDALVVQTTATAAALNVGSPD